jgi:hypothetical protein
LSSIKRQHFFIDFSFQKFIHIEITSLLFSLGYMTDQITFDPTSIPPIGGMAPIPQPVKKEEKPLKLLDNAPNEVSLGGFFGKIFI